MLFYILSVVWSILAYYYLVKPLNYWKERHVKCISAIPIFGSCLSLLTRKCSNLEFFHDIYNKYPDERYVGMFSLHRPALMIRDPKLLKDILIKQFETFPSHRTTVPTEVDYLWSENLFAIKSLEKWHRLRTILSPGFTTGKLKSMYFDLRETAKAIHKNQCYENGIAEVDLKDATFTYALDSLFKHILDFVPDKSSDLKYELRCVMKELIDLTGIKGLMIIFSFFPFLLRITKSSIVNDQMGAFFRSLVEQTIKERKEKNIVAPDMFQLLIQAQEQDFHDDKRAHHNGQFKITDDLIISQVLIFAFAGVDTVSTVLSYAIYELALNPKIQNRLQAEIDEAVSECNGNITYEILDNIKYLNMVVSEVLRKWPPFYEVDRVSVKPYTIKAEKPGERDLFLDKDSMVIIPIHGTHWNPKYFPNPEKFDPERFSTENASNIVPYTFIPFGHGPRNCIGNRFALLEMKIALMEILKECTILRTDKTRVPLNLNKNDFSPLPLEGIWVGFKKRKFQENCF